MFFIPLLAFLCLALTAPLPGQIVPEQPETAPEPAEVEEETPPVSNEAEVPKPVDGKESPSTVDDDQPAIEYPLGAPRSRPEQPTGGKGVFEGSAGTFEFVAADQTSLQVARKLGREVLEVCDEMITPPQERIPKIDVKLAPDGRGNLGDKAFNIYQDLAGDYGLAVRWNEQLSASLFVQALVESYLRQLVFTLSGKNRSERIPSWLIAGASLRVQIAFRPELIEFLKQIGRDMPMPDLDSVFANRPLEELTLRERVAAFWFLELLENSLPNQKRYRTFFDKSIVDGDPVRETLEDQTEGLRGFGNGIEAWWVVGFQDLVHDETGVVFSISRSGQIVFLLNRFELLQDGRPGFTGVQGLWEFREDPLIQRELNDRLQGVRAVLPRINPVFHNSLRGLGVVMQTLLDGTREEFDEAVEEFSTEVDRAAALARDAQRLVDEPEADLSPDTAQNPF